MLYNCRQGQTMFVFPLNCCYINDNKTIWEKHFGIRFIVNTWHSWKFSDQQIWQNGWVKVSVWQIGIVVWGGNLNVGGFRSEKLVVHVQIAAWKHALKSRDVGRVEYFRMNLKFIWVNIKLWVIKMTSCLHIRVFTNGIFFL